MPNEIPCVVFSFDEAVQQLAMRRSSDCTTPLLIEFKFSTEGLPDSIITEFRQEALALGISIKVA
tara:strand:- start:1070 stop:1264 length:195 start_codon:yes stop_codon:yes gene_type:complete